TWCVIAEAKSKPAALVTVRTSLAVAAGALSSAALRNSRLSQMPSALRVDGRSGGGALARLKMPRHNACEGTPPPSCLLSTSQPGSHPTPTAPRSCAFGALTAITCGNSCVENAYLGRYF